jgi:hypothetical protein
MGGLASFSRTGILPVPQKVTFLVGWASDPAHQRLIDNGARCQERENAEAVITNAEAVVTNIRTVVTNVEAVVTNVEAVVTNIRTVVTTA